MANGMAASGVNCASTSVDCFAIEMSLLIADNQQINNCRREIRFKSFYHGGDVRERAMLWPR